MRPPVKLMILGRRASGTTRAQAQTHLRERHGRLVVLPPADAGAMPADYTQNHVLDGLYPAAVGRAAIERDLFTEIWFDSFDHLRASTTTPYYVANLKPDEPRFVDNATVEKMVAREERFGAEPAGVFKAFWLAGVKPGEDAAAAREALLATAHATAGNAGFALNTVLPAPDGTEPATDFIIELWFADQADADAAARNLPVDIIDPQRSLALLCEEHGTDRLRAELSATSVNSV